MIKGYVIIFFALVLLMLGSTQLSKKSSMLTNQDGQLLNFQETSKKRLAYSKDLLSENYIKATYTYKNLILDEAKLYFYDAFKSQAFDFWRSQDIDSANECKDYQDDDKQLVSEIFKTLGLNMDYSDIAMAQTMELMTSISLSDETYGEKFTDLRYAIDRLVKPFPDGVYLLSMDDDKVCFLIEDGGKVFFLNTNNLGVVVFVSLNKFLRNHSFQNVRIAPITHNRNIVKAWLMDEKINFIKESDPKNKKSSKNKLASKV